MNYAKLSLKIKSLLPGYFFLRHIKNVLRPKEPEYRILNKKLSSYDCFIDVGANLGIYSYLFCRSQSSQVYSFEPNPFLAEFLSLALPKKAKLRNVALGAVISTETLHVPSNELTSGRSSLNKVVAEKYKPELVEFPVKVEVLDNIFRQISVASIVFVKIDVEGFEAKVLSGLKVTLKENRNIDFMIELSFNHNPDLQYVVSLLYGHGYNSFYYIENQDECALREVSETELIEVIKSGHENIFFSKNPEFSKF